MAEIEFKISSLLFGEYSLFFSHLSYQGYSFLLQFIFYLHQHEYNKRNLYVLQLYFHLAFSRFFSFLSFLSLWAPIDASFISDKTKTNFYLFPRGQVSNFGCFSWRGSQTPECEFIQKWSFFISVFFGIWVSSVSKVEVLSLSWTNGNWLFSTV